MLVLNQVNPRIFFPQYLSQTTLICYCSVTIVPIFSHILIFEAKQKSQILCGDFHSVNIYPLHTHK